MQELAVKGGPELALPTLLSVMQGSIVVNENGQVWLLHDRPFPVILNWVEFHAQERTMTLIARSGHTIEYGEKINPAIVDKILDTHIIFIVQIQDEAIVDLYVVPLIKNGA